MKIIKKFIIITIMLFIKFAIQTYRIISKIWRKHNVKIKEIIRNFYNMLRNEL